MPNRTPTAPTCSLHSAAARLENKRMFWLVAAFLVCPCHLPLTLGLVGLMLAGTTAGALLQSHPFVAGVLVTAVWATGTWRGFHLLRAARRCANRQAAAAISSTAPCTARGS